MRIWDIPLLASVEHPPPSVLCVLPSGGQVEEVEVEVTLFAMTCRHVTEFRSSYTPPGEDITMCAAI